MLIRKICIAASLIAALSMPAFGQALSTGKVTTTNPTYTNGQAGALSLDTSGNLRVVSSSGPGGTQDTNLVEIDGVPVSNTTPGTLDVTCIAGCVAGVGTVNGQATTAAPTYVDATPNPLSLDLAGNLRVIISNVSIPISGTIAATQSGAWNVGVLSLPSIPAGSNNIGDVDVLTLPSIPAGSNNIGDVDVLTLPSIPAGSNNIGSVIPPTTGLGLSNYSLIAAASTNATSVVSGAHSLYELSVYNNSATIAYLKLYDSGSAPTCGSGTPVGRYLIPGAASGGAGSNVNINVGKSFANGIAFCITTGIADSDTSAVAATTYLVNLTYK